MIKRIKQSVVGYMMTISTVLLYILTGSLSTNSLANPVYMKSIMRHRTLCPTFITVVSDILCTISDIMYVISYYLSITPRTSCLTF